jgi:4-hydroxy-tetrahydrodipicolinate synthase
LKLDQLTGVLIALVTPMTRDGRVDEAAVKRLIEHVVGGGVHGVLALGSTGETASLDEPSRRKMLTAVIDASAGRVPVICGIAQSHVASARVEVRAAAQLGADAALVAPPFYYPTDQAGVLAFYRQLAADAALPLMLYNIPQFTKVVADPATVATLASEGTIKGIKDSSRDFEYFESVCIATRELPAFRIFTGSDTMLLPSMVMGGHGTICGAGNIVPRLVVEIFDEYRRGNVGAARDAQDRLCAVVQAVRAGVFPLAIKSALHMIGVCESWSAPPVRELDDTLARSLRESLARSGVLTKEQVG